MNLADPSIQVLGAYKLEPNADLFAMAMETKYGGLKMSHGERHEAEHAVREELSGAALLEVLVTGRDKRFDVGDFSQDGSDQAPYNEAFLSADGTAVLSRWFDVPSGDTLRIAFYLHFFDPNRQLITSYGSIAVPPLQSIPQRLHDLVPYEAVD